MSVKTQIEGNLPTGLSRPALRALAGAGISNLAQLSQFSEAETRNLHGIGPNVLEKLRRALAENQLAWKEHQPRIEQRDAHAYAAVRLQAPIPFGKFLQPAWSKVHNWLAGQGIPHEPAIIRYLTTDMSTKLDMDVGFVIDNLIPGSAGVLTDTLPDGQYACLTYTGSYRGKGVYKANVDMIEWAAKNGITWKTAAKDGAEWWDARVEWYFNDPAVDPNPETDLTELTFMVSEEK